MSDAETLAKIANVTDASNIFEAFWKRYKSDPIGQVYWYPTLIDPLAKKRTWSAESYQDIAGRIIQISHYLASLGVTSGTKVAILSNTRREWSLADLAILGAGGITVSIYQSLPSSDVGYILHDSDSEIVFAENEAQVTKLLKICSEPFLIPESEGREAKSVTLNLKKIITFEETPEHELVVSSSSICEGKEPKAEPPDAAFAKTREDIASIVYTSGTTGPPKGVVQTHGNHLSNVRQAAESGVFAPEGSLFLYLPLAHSFARLIHYIGFLTPAVLAYPTVADTKSSKIDLELVADDMAQANTNVVPSVPRLFEKIASVLCAQAAGIGVKSRLLRLCIDNATRVYEAKSAGQEPSKSASLFFSLLSPIRKKIKKSIFGSNFTHAVAGGAKLETSVCKFFDALEITILEGYGLTETCVATNVNLVNKRRIGSVGPAFKDVEIKIDQDDGEILFKGPNISSLGYYNRPAATAEAWTSDGWFKTGDIGRVDPDGFLFITDRKKDIIVTAGGKKIPPLSIEGRFKSCPHISQVVLYGDGKPYCVALITLNAQAIRLWLAGIEPTLVEAPKLHDLPVVLSMVEKEVARVNEGLASFESIKKFAVLPEDFTIEDGLLTPTLKVKRKAVYAKYRHEIDKLY